MVKSKTYAEAKANMIEFVSKNPNYIVSKVNRKN